MSALTYLDNWIPIEWDSEVITRVMRASAVEATASRHSMFTATKRILRSSGLTVAAGTTYTDDASDLDYMTLTARRFIARVQVDEDDLADAESIVNVIGQRGQDWAISYANTFDNGCLGVTGVENGTTVPFTSVYKAVRTTNAATDYTADDNYISWDDDNTTFPSTGGGASAYEKFTELLRLVEVGQYWDPSSALLIAHPGYRDAFRLTTDGQGRPIFVLGTNGTPDTLFGVPIFWSRGAKTSATLSGAPAGNDLMIFVGDTRLLKLGVRSGPETRVDSARAQDDSDNTALKFRTRRGFGVGNENGFSVLERLSD